MASIFGYEIPSYVSDIGKLVGAGIGGYNAYNQSQGRGGIADLLHDQEQRNYDESKRYYDSYLDYQKQLQGVQASNAAARAAASAAAASAARANALATQKANIKGNKVEIKNLKGIADLFRPANESMQTLLPQATQTYSNSLSGINALLGSLQSPESKAKMDQSIPAFNVKVPLPDYLKRKA